MRHSKQQAALTRSTILDAAEELFLCRGVSSTTLAHVADAAGVTRGAVYFHFCGKEALFAAVQERGKLPQEYFTRMMQAVNAGDPLERIETCSIDVLSFLSTDERAKRIMTILLLRCEEVGEMQLVLRRVRAANDSMHQAILMALQKASERDLLHPDWRPTDAAMALKCCLIGVITEWLRIDEGFDLMLIGGRSLRALFTAIRLERRSQEATPRHQDFIGTPKVLVT